MRLLLIFFLLGHAASAQEAVSAAGNDASGSGGSVSYTAGQVAYTQNTGAGGSVSQGVQYAYEFLTVGPDRHKNIVLSMEIYPNPAYELVKLKTGTENLQLLNYQLYDMSGKLILDQRINNAETIIPLDDLNSATYFLKITDNSNAELKTFKIIKN